MNRRFIVTVYPLQWQVWPLIERSWAHHNAFNYRLYIGPVVVFWGTI